MMLDALVGVIITGVVGAGTLVIAGRLAESQRDLRVQSSAIRTTRALLTTNATGLCGAPTTTIPALGNAGTNITVNVACAATVPVTVAPAVTAGGTIPATNTLPSVRRVEVSVPLAALGVEDPDTTAAIVIGAQ